MPINILMKNFASLWSKASSSTTEKVIKKALIRERRRSIKFPVKLMYVLEECEDLHVDSIRWSRNGLSFEILDPDCLTENVLSIVFKELKFSSFLRKSLDPPVPFDHSNDADFGRIICRNNIMDEEDVYLFSSTSSASNTFSQGSDLEMTGETSREDVIPYVEDTTPTILHEIGGLELNQQNPQAIDDAIRANQEFFDQYNEQQKNLLSPVQEQNVKDA